jgi:hypothetical protein
MVLLDLRSQTHAAVNFCLLFFVISLTKAMHFSLNILLISLRSNYLCLDLILYNFKCTRFCRSSGLASLSGKQEDNIKMSVNTVGRRGVDLIHMALDREE